MSRSRFSSNRTSCSHRSSYFSPGFSHLFLAPLLVLYLVLITTAAPSYAATPCGGAGQRACCVTERVPSCNPGFHEELGCSGNCTCGGANPFGAFNSVGHCVPNAPPPIITPCGGVGQRACCVTERVPSCNPGAHVVLGCNGNCTCGGPNPFGALKAIGHCEANPVITPCGGIGQRACCVTERVPSCNPGAHEVLGCNGNCICGGPNPAGALKAIGHCEANPVITPCGGVGQRACCVTERVPSCNPGAHEVLGCSGNCTCGGPNPAGALKAIGRCEANPVVTPCGGPGQRACCVTERIPSCNPGMREVLGCSGNCTCGGPNPAGALKAIGHCEAQSCGGLGQRACCVTERVPSCDLGLLEVPGCTGDCKCGGANPLGALNAIGHCENGCTAAKSIVEKLERDLANAKNQLNQFCSQGAVVRPQPLQNPGGAAIPPSIQRQLAPQLLKR
ncbi:MAG: hypothetical protein LWW87_05675 [Geobacteraceae bacterium]|nr:hypothetical protein [Geobacteraceae bacterium]